MDASRDCPPFARVMPAGHLPLNPERTRCYCADCRHERFNPGPPTTSPRRLNFYGHFKRGDTAKLRRLKKEVALTPGGSLWRFVTKLVRQGRLSLAQKEEKA